jgi:hypothetical protein
MPGSSIAPLSLKMVGSIGSTPAREGFAGFMEVLVVAFIAQFR